MRIIVGLGNPGSAYAGTRHNVGFAVVEKLAQRWRVSFGRAGPDVRMARGRINAEPVLLVQPQLYMNRSGAALAGVGRSVTAEELIVIHDDLDLECGCVRVKRGGGTAGHHGLNSIVECYGPDFARVRVGIGRPPRGTDTADYVLSRWGTEESERITAAVDRAAAAVECIVREGEEAAMNCFNVRQRTDAVAALAPMGRN
jgi:PTH1 family peptidyl-tRNA hydrolase